MITEGY